MLLGLFCLCTCSKTEAIEDNNDDKLPSSENKPKAVKTEAIRYNGKCILYRGGKPYFIEGASCAGGGYTLLNNLRKYRIATEKNIPFKVELENINVEK